MSTDKAQQHKDYCKEYYRKNKKEILRKRKKYQEENKEKIREQRKKYYENNKERLLKQKKEYRKNNPEKLREIQQRWKEKNPEKARMNNKRWMRQLKEDVIELLGGKCVYCGCNDVDALEVNHKNSDGYKERYRKKGGTKLYSEIRQGIRPTDDLELTCKICNAWYYLINGKGLDDGWTITYRKV